MIFLKYVYFSKNDQIINRKKKLNKQLGKILKILLKSKQKQTPNY